MVDSLRSSMTEAKFNRRQDCPGKFTRRRRRRAVAASEPSRDFGGLRRGRQAVQYAQVQFLGHRRGVGPLGQALDQRNSWRGPGSNRVAVLHEQGLISGGKKLELRLSRSAAKKLHE